MRSLKTFMRNRKKEMLGCGPCECRTLQCWRYANENCGCGEDVVQESIAFDGIYDGVTIPVWQSYNIGFTAIPEDLEYTITLSNQSLEIENQVDEWTHHTMDLRAMSAWHDWLIPCEVTISSANASATTVIYAQQLAETIGAPTQGSISFPQWTTEYISFSFSPTNAQVTESISITSSNTNVVSIWWPSASSPGNYSFEVYWTWEWNATVTYTLLSDPTQTYDVDVTVTSLP